MSDDDIDRQKEMDNLVRITCALMLDSQYRLVGNEEFLVKRAFEIYDQILRKVYDDEEGK